MPNKKSVGAFALVILLLSVFLSRTVYNYRLPLATAAAPISGRLDKRETASGVTRRAETAEIYSKLGGAVFEVPVKEGDCVKKGAVLARLSFETDETVKKLNEIEISRRRITFEISGVRMKMENIRRKVTDLSTEEYHADTISTFDLEQLENEIANAEEEYRKLESLYEAGAATSGELEKASFSLQSQYSKLENMRDVISDGERKNAEGVSEKENSRSKQLADYEYELKMMEQDIVYKQLDLENLDLQAAALEKTLADYEACGVISAPEDGTVMSVNVKKGQRISDYQFIAELAIGDGFYIDFTVSEGNNFVAAGDECVVGNTAHGFDAVVAKVEPVERGKRVTVLVESEEITEGETFEATFQKESSRSYTLVPNGAVNADSDGYYLYQVKRRDGILGKEFYTVKIPVRIGDSDGQYTAVIQGVGFFEPVVLTSDKFVGENDVIRLKNESDFFEN